MKQNFYYANGKLYKELKPTVINGKKKWLLMSKDNKRKWITEEEIKTTLHDAKVDPQPLPTDVQNVL